MSNDKMVAPPCRLCGGNAGRLNDRGEHNLCVALARLGQATPSLGIRCAECNGIGCKPRSVVGPVNPSQKTVDAWAPRCLRCGGTGVEPGTCKQALGLGMQR